MGGDERQTGRPSYRAVLQAEPQLSAKHFAPSAGRNVEPILSVLRSFAPVSGRALEIASGTGQHVCAFAKAFADLTWQPSDPDPEARASIEAWVADEPPGNVEAPMAIDVTRPGWEDSVNPALDLVVCINMIHIAPWAACEGLFAGSGRLLRVGGLLYLYGPFRRGGRHTAPSNAEFDRSLRTRNPDWGVRDVDEVARSAADHGIELYRIVDMPANNLSVLFVRTDD